MRLTQAQKKLIEPVSTPRPKLLFRVKYSLYTDSSAVRDRLIVAGDIIEAIRKTEQMYAFDVLLSVTREASEVWA